MIWSRACCRVLDDDDEVVAYEQHWAGVGALGLIGRWWQYWKYMAYWYIRLVALSPWPLVAGLLLLVVQMSELSGTKNPPNWTFCIDEYSHLHNHSLSLLSSSWQTVRKVKAQR